jgi:hypothetical protein
MFLYLISALLLQVQIPYFFGSAGYKGGAEPPRSQPKERFLDVLDMGAIANDGRDDIDAIQAGVDSLAKVGGGVLKFPRGVFDFDVESTGRLVRISTSNIVLRGYGEGVDGTHLIDHHSSPSPEEDKPWLAGTRPSFFLVEPKTDVSFPPKTGRLVGTLTTARLNSRKVRVAPGSSLSGLKPGEIVYLTQEDPGDSTLLFAVTSPLRELASHKLDIEGESKYVFRQWLEVQEVGLNSITFGTPIAWNLESRWKPKLWTPNGAMLTEVGIENFWFSITGRPAFMHHRSGEDDNGADAIRVNGLTNGWLRNIHTEGVSTAIGMSNSLACSIADVRISAGANGWGHNGIVLHNTSSCLVTRVQGGSQMHTWSLNGYCVGNVYYLCQGNEPSAIDTHGGLGVFNLFDTMLGGVFKSGGNGTNTPPGMGHGLVLWNWRYGLTEPYKQAIYSKVFDARANPGTYAVGIYPSQGQPFYWIDEMGQERNGNTVLKSKHMGAVVQAWGKVPTIPSLYQWQRRNISTLSK